MLKTKFFFNQLWLVLLICIFHAFIPTIYLFSQPYRGGLSAAYTGSALLVGAAYAYWLGSLALIGLVLWRSDLLSLGLARLWAAPRWAVWLTVAVFWMAVLRLGLIFGDRLGEPFNLLPFYAWGIGVGGAVIALRGLPAASEAEHGQRLSIRARGTLAAFFAALSLLRDALISFGFAYQYIYDSPTYIYSLSEFLDPSNPSAWKRSIPYPLMNVLVGTINEPWFIVWFQMGVAALAVGLLVFVLARYQVWGAIFAGLFFALDANWGVANRAILTESTYISFHVLALAWLLSHYQRRAHIKTWELLAAGLFYGWTLTIRPSGILFAIPMVLAYGLWLASARKAVLVAAGIAAFILLSSLINAARVDHFGVVGETGSYVAFTLFGNGLFSPDNGEQSARLDGYLRQCYGDPEYEKFNTATENFYIHTHYRNCLNQVSGGDRNFESTVYAGAFREAILADVPRFAQVVVAELGRMLRYPVQSNVIGAGLSISPSVSCADTFYWEYAWCDELPTAFEVAPWDGRIVDYTRYLTYPMQPYLLMLPPSYFEGDYFASEGDFLSNKGVVSRSSYYGALAAFLMFFVFVALVTREGERLLAFGAAAFIGYVALSVAAGHVFLPRYAIPLSPFYGILAALGLRIVLAETGLLKRIDVAQLLNKVQPFLLIATGVILLIVLALIVGTQAEGRYVNVGRVAEAYLAEQGLDRVYNPRPFDPDPWRVKWGRPEALSPSGLDDWGQGALAAWNESLLSGYLLAVDLPYLIFDQVWWGNLSAEQQAIISNPTHYRLIESWEDATMRQSVWLYEVVGDVRPAIYSTESLQVFPKADGSLDFYAVQDGAGVYVLTVKLDDLPSQTRLVNNVEGENGWLVRIRLQNSEYQFSLFAADEELIDDGFIWPQDEPF